MRPITRGPKPKDAQGNEIVFAEYAHARRYLFNNIGRYCSYCERHVNSNLAVEHIESKDLNPHLEREWTNFLLGCTNCNSTKGADPIILGEYVWPQVDNTYEQFAYDGSGIVSIQPSVTNVIIRDRIQKMIDLVGLDKVPPKGGTRDWQKASDMRFYDRKEAWIEASDHLNKYDKADVATRNALLGSIVTIVKLQGFWSIWMQVFKNYSEVQQALIDAFPGTRYVL